MLQMPDVLDTRVAPHVRILNAALDDDISSPAGLIVRGRIAPATLRFLKVDNYYQRQAEPRAELWAAYRDGVVTPDIDVGVRGDDYDVDGPDIIIRAPAYIIDGQQRVWNALQFMDQIAGVDVRLGAQVHFASTREWEAHRFTDLNRFTKSIRPSIYLRNWREKHIGIATLWGLTTNEPAFVLHERVCWEQNMRRGQLINAFLLAQIASRLHAHHVGVSSYRVEKLAQAVDSCARAVKTNIFRDNVRTFFEVIDHAFGVRTIEYHRRAPHLKSTFLAMLARLFSRHLNFWDGGDNRLVVNAEWRQTLARFPLNDPEWARLCGSGGAASEILYEMMLRRMNSGKRIHHLRPRHGAYHGD